MRKNPARENIQPEQTKTQSTADKDPSYSTIKGTERILPLRVGDSEADIFVKMFNLFKSEHDYKIKKIDTCTTCPICRSCLNCQGH